MLPRHMLQQQIQLKWSTTNTQDVVHSTAGDDTESLTLHISNIIFAKTL